VYDGGVRRINVHLDEDLDAALAAEAARVGVSKAALLRRAARAWLDRPGDGGGGDAWAVFTGACVVAGEEGGGAHDDEVIYGP